MANTTTVKLVCNECGAENEVTINLSMNAQVDTEAYVKLLTGKLFSFECSSCGKKGILNHDMVYHDVVHRVIIHYVSSPDMEKNALDAIKKMKADKALPSDYTFRIVKTQNALREKAMLFEHGLDDRIMEILKGICVVNIHKDHPEVDIKDALFLSVNGKWILQLLGDKPMTAEIPMVRYDGLRRGMGEIIENTRIDNYAVDAAWALKVVQNHKDKLNDIPQG